MVKHPIFKSALALVVLVACLGLMGDAEADDLVPLWSDQPSSSQNPTSVAMSDDGSVINRSNLNFEGEENTEDSVVSKRNN